MGRHADEHLRRFIAARERSDAAGMRLFWEALVIDFHDRMDGFVYAAHKGRLDADEHELAVELGLARFSTRLVETFEGVSIGELVNACKTLANFICIDVQRKSMRVREHEGPSLDDEGWNEADEAFRRYDDGEHAADARDFLDWAMPQLNADRRRVLELTLYGADLPEIMQELGISRDNAYQRRSRGLKDLAKLKERYDA